MPDTKPDVPMTTLEFTLTLRVQVPVAAKAQYMPDAEEYLGEPDVFEMVTTCNATQLDVREMSLEEIQTKPAMVEWSY